LIRRVLSGLVAAVGEEGLSVTVESRLNAFRTRTTFVKEQRHKTRPRAADEAVGTTTEITTTDLIGEGQARDQPPNFLLPVDSPEAQANV